MQKTVVSIFPFRQKCNFSCSYEICIREIDFSVRYNLSLHTKEQNWNQILIDVASVYLNIKQDFVALSNFNLATDFSLMFFSTCFMQH